MRILANALILSVGIMLGRIAGFFREVSLASYFGVSVEADIAVLLLTVPDMLVSLLATGALSAALIPEYKRLGAGLRSQVLFLQTSALVFGVFILLAFLLGYFSSTVIYLVAPGLLVGDTAFAQVLLEHVFWVIPLTALAGVSASYLQANNRFALPALSTFIYNGIIVLTIVYFLDPGDPLRSLVIGILAAAALRWLAQLARVPWRALSLRCLRWTLINRQLLIRYSQAIGAGGLLVLFPVIARAIASLLEPGSMALANYAYKLVEFPLGVAITVISVAIFPVLSEAFVRGGNPNPHIHTGLRWVIVLSLAMLFTLYAFRDVITQVAFGWGSMTSANVALLSTLFGIAVFALPFQGVSSLLVAIFNARRDTSTPLKINLVALMLFVPLSWLGSQSLGLPGIFVALVIVFAMIVVFQLFLLERLHRVSLLGFIGSRSNLFLLLGYPLITMPMVMLQGYVSDNLWLSLLIAVVNGFVLLIFGIWFVGEHRNVFRMFSRRRV